MRSEDTTATYRYNAQGYRTEKTVNGATTRYLYEGDKVVLETDKTNNQKSFQVYGTNLLYRSVVESDGMGAEEYYYLYNAHGDVTGLIDARGNIAATYDYDAFGTILSETGSANNNIKYAGYQHDKETGLYYLNARYYDSVTARFISEDTYRGQANDPLSLNLYSYCANDPIKYWDPSGHKHIDITNSGIILTVDESDYNSFRNTGWTKYNGEALEYKTIHIVGNINTVYTGSNTQQVNNYGSIGSLYMYDKSIATINNHGNISDIYTGQKSTTVINNTGNIDSIYSGNNSYTYITSNRNIGNIYNSEKSYMSIDNYGNIGNIFNESKCKIEIGYNTKGSIKQVYGSNYLEKGWETKIRRFFNRIDLNMNMCATLYLKITICSLIF